MHGWVSALKSILFVYILGAGSVYGISLAQKYPGYSYVFHEFDVDESYLYNEAFVSFAAKHEKQLRSFYSRSLLRGKEVLPTMQGLLVEDGVSDLFIYLSMVESGFSTDAVSPKKAVGLWQFMPATAKEYNLTVRQSYDARYNTFSATAAAIDYLNRLHQEFGKWYLAAMAYNCGEGCIRRAIARAGTDELSVLTDENLKYVPHETRQYMKKILLLAMIGEDQALDFNEDPGNALIEVEIVSGTSLKEVASLLHMNEETLSALNKSLKNGVVPEDQPTYKITIPLEKIYAFYLRYKPPATTKHYQSHMITHDVKLGETLESIAKQYEANAEEIKSSNHLSDTFLTVGDLLVIPVTQHIFEKVAKSYK